jgi:hypothetical protein
LLPAVREALPETIVEATEDCCLSVRFDRFAFAAGEIAAAVMSRADVEDFQIDEPAVEDVIKRVYLGQLSVEQTGRTPEPPADRPVDGRAARGTQAGKAAEVSEETETPAEAAASGAMHHP